MNISRGEVTQFQYSSAIPATKETIAGLALGTADATTERDIRITDLKMSCGGTGRTIKLYTASYSSEQALEFDVPANTIVDLHWDVPYKLTMLSSTAETRRFVASASGTGVKYSVSGYIEK